MDQSAAENATRSWWARLRKTPLADLVRGRLTGSLDLRAAIAEAALPERLAELARRAARRTRLSSREQVDVARELAQHFRDGLASGSTAEQLIQSFGDVRQAARLIRRAKLRARPLAWRVWRRAWQVVGLFAAVLVSVYSFLAIRTFTARPTIAHDYRHDVIGPTQDVPEADRGWPFYRVALQRRVEEPEIIADELPVETDGNEPVPLNQTDLSNSKWINLSDVKPASRYWPFVIEWLDANQSALEAVWQGAAKPRLGFVFGDPADQALLDKSENAKHDWTGNDMLNIPVPQVAAVRHWWRLLPLDARRLWPRAIGSGS